MKPAGLSVDELALHVALTADRLNEIVKGKRTITAGMALRLGKFFGVSPETWMTLQMEYDLKIALHTTWKEVEPFIGTQRNILRPLPGKNAEHGPRKGRSQTKGKAVKRRKG